MNDIDKKMLPSVEQVEFIITEWGKYSVEEFADRFNLPREVIDETIKGLQRLRREDNSQSKPAIVCFRNDTLESIIRCAGSRHGYT